MPALRCGSTAVKQGKLRIDFRPYGALKQFCFRHCQQGMVFAVNPTAAKSFAAFQAAAKASTPDGSPSSSGSSSGSSGTAASSTPSASTTNGAMRHSGSAAIVLAVMGITASILL
jgi:hypothetical protein